MFNICNKFLKMAGKYVTIYIVAYLPKARIVKPAETAVARERSVTVTRSQQQLHTQQQKGFGSGVFRAVRSEAT
jgi:hypothetical protein